MQLLKTTKYTTLEIIIVNLWKTVNYNNQCYIFY